MIEQFFGIGVLFSMLVADIAAALWVIRYFWKQGYKQETLITIVCVIIGSIAIATQSVLGTVIWLATVVVAAYIASIFLEHVLGKIGDKGSKLLKVAIYTAMPTGTIWKFAAIAAKNFQNNRQDAIHEQTVVHEQTVDEAVDANRIDAEVHDTVAKQPAAATS